MEMELRTLRRGLRVSEELQLPTGGIMLEDWNLHLSILKELLLIGIEIWLLLLMFSMMLRTPIEALSICFETDSIIH